MKTKLFSLFVALIATMSAFAFQSGDLYYYITSDSTAEVTYQKYNSSDNYAGLTSAVIPESVTYNDTTYRVTNIGDRAFSGCSKLTSVTIPNSVTSIGEWAFSGCSKLTSVTIPNSVTSIGSYAFSGCSGLTSVTIPNSVTSIGRSAFSGCSSLTSVTIPNGVTSIGEYAFSGCSGLTSVTVENGNTVYDSRNNCNAIIETRTNTLIAGCQNTTIPNSVTSIGEYAFSGCSSLTSITIPNSVRSIGNSAFSGCSSLTSVTIPNGVTSIGEYAFSGCSSLTSVTIPNGVTSIGKYTFSGCSGLTSVTIPNSVTSIGDWAFDGCSGLTSVTIGNSVTSIGSSAFKGCAGLTSITIPNSVTSIGWSAFESCTDLISVTIGNGVTSIKNGTFSDCSSLASLTIGYSVTSIPYNAFADCKSLTSVVWNAKDYPDFTSNKTLFYYNDRSDNDFDLRSQITSFVFGDSVQHIPAYICTGMEKLTSITIPNSVTSIGDNEFASCSKLTTVTIGNGVTSIGSKAFSGCSNLETVIFGSGLQNIDDNAFQGCQNIYEMTVYATQVPNVVAEKEGSTYYGTFQGVSKLAELHVPAESVKKYKIHPVWGLFNVITAIPYTVTLLCDNVQGAVVGSGSYQPNEQVTITAKPNAGYRFVQWSDGITTNPRTIVVVSDTTLTAEFEEIPASEYTVSVVVDPTQHGAVHITLTAVPDEGYQFARWSDGNTENPRTILIKENMTLSATFNLSTKANNASAEDSQDGTRKVFRNGQMYIIRGDKTYTATGAQL